MQQRLRAGIFSPRAELMGVTAAIHLSACTEVRQECAGSLGGMGRRTRAKGTKHSPGSPSDTAAQTGLLQHLGNHLLPGTTTEDLHTHLALLNASLTLTAPLRAAHKPVWFKTGLEGTPMKNKPHKYPGYDLCKAEDVRSEQSQARTGSEHKSEPLSTSTNK